MHVSKILASGVGLMIAASSAVAQDGPVTIHADSMVLIERDRIFRYIGNVEVIQNGMILHAEQADAHYSEAGISELTKFIATGDRIFLTSTDQDVESDLVEYDFTRGIITFSGDVVTVANGTRIESDEMVVDSGNSKTTFRVDPSTGRRLHFVGTPTSAND